MGTDSQEKLHKAPADSCLDDLLDLVVGAIREVGERPAGICEHLLIIGVDQPCQRGERKLCLHRHPAQPVKRISCITCKIRWAAL